MKRIIQNLILAIITTLVCLIAAELFFRAFDGYSLNITSLPERQYKSGFLHDKVDDMIERMEPPAGLQKQWFWQDPDFEKESTEDPEHKALVKQLMPLKNYTFAEILKEWNTNYLMKRICEEGADSEVKLFSQFPDFTYAYKAPDDAIFPRYRFMSGFSFPDSEMKFNSWGFRSREIDLQKAPDVIRLAFVGASTTQQHYTVPFSYPEYIDMWLNLWAEEQQIPYRFEVINAGREAQTSEDIAAIVEKELVPFNPDLVIYYEGSNQFNFWDLCLFEENTRTGQGSQSSTPALFRYSALARRLWILSGKSLEPNKPDYQVIWPESVDIQEPDPDNPDLPLTLPVIVRDLDKIRSSLDSIGGHLILSNFVTLVNKGMYINPVTHYGIHHYWNDNAWPLKYADLRIFADFQNRVFYNYAKDRDILFMDIDALIPQDPDLFTDGVHMHSEGIRFRAWMTAGELISLISDMLENNTIPMQDPVIYSEHPYIDHSSAMKLRIDCLDYKEVDQDLPVLSEIQKTDSLR